MYICLCKSLTDRDIRRGVFQGEVACMQSLRERLGVATGCGSCEAAARRCLDEALAHKRHLRSSPPDSMDRGAGIKDVHDRQDLGDAPAA